MISSAVIRVKSRNDKIMEGAAYWCAFYRANPARFAQDYLHLKLKLFQKILLTMMMLSTVFTFIGARGELLLCHVTH